MLDAVTCVHNTNNPGQRESSVMRMADDRWVDLRSGLHELLSRQNRKMRLMADLSGLVCDLDDADRALRLDERVSGLVGNYIGTSPQEDLTGYPQPADRPGAYRDNLQEAMRRASEEPLPAPPQPQQMAYQIPPGMGTWDGRSLTPPQWGEYDRNLDPTRGRGERG